tara:strand:- start:511 stop:3714 length:3204 start_codon:yes stop_codon:yes gene_type:complete
VYVDFQNDSTNEVLTLKYKLFDTSFAKKWFSLLNHSLKSPDFYIDKDGEFFGPDFDSIEVIVQGLKDNIKVFNTYAEEKGLPDRLDYKPHVGMSRDFLVKMHDSFEEYAHNEVFTQDRSVLNALTDFNINIHRAEVYLPEVVNNGSHCQAIIQPVKHVELKDEDYLEFTTDYNWGDLYVVYGMSGQPTLNAFYGKSEPRPQDCYTPGLQMMFLNDLVFPESFREPCKRWLWENYKIDIDDPRSAFGFLHLGCLEEKPEDRKSFMQLLAQHKKIVSIRTEGPNDFPISDLPFTKSGAGKHVIAKKGLENVNVDERMKQKYEKELAQKLLNRKARSKSENLPDINTPAEWPYDREIFYHLDYKPYIDLEVKFDSTKLLDEANKALAYFVTHRGYDQSKMESDSGQWKSLSLQSVHGDFTKTSYHTEYGLENEVGLYKRTPFAELCPETMRLIDHLTDTTACERIRFMLLEPGAIIHTHRDMKDGSTGMAVNISLNMPEGCEFWANLNEDGTKNEYSVKLPFSDDGSVFLFNNGKFHSVWNRSSEPRMHIIFHGPVRFTDEQIIEMARRQNGISSRREILEKLGNKKIKLVEDMEQDSMFYSEWKSLGYSTKSTGSNYEFFILEHGLDKETTEKVTDTTTLASIFPKPYKRIDFKSLQENLTVAYENNCEFAVLVCQGTYFKNIRQFNIDLERAFAFMKAEGASAMGHIMDFQKDGAIPYFHEQFLILDLKKWKDLGFISLGDLFNNEKVVFPAHNKSDTCVHDDYTPHWISPGNNVFERSGENNFGTKLMIESLARSFKILNVIEELRANKEYAYPLEKLDYRYDNIRKQIETDLEAFSELAFFFNNENLDFIELGGFTPDTFVSVSAGFKPIKMAEMFWKGRDIKNPHFIDFSRVAIDYVSKLVKCEAVDEISNLIATLSPKSTGERYEAHEAKVQLEGIIRDHFEGDSHYLIENIRKLKKANFTHIDLINEHDKFLSLLNRNQSSMIWVSNAFYCNPLYYLITKERADSQFLSLGKSIASFYNEQLWKHKTSYTMIVANNPENKITSVITDGCVFEKEFFADNWIKV